MQNIRNVILILLKDVGDDKMDIGMMQINKRDLRILYSDLKAQLPDRNIDIPVLTVLEKSRDEWTESDRQIYLNCIQSRTLEVYLPDDESITVCKNYIGNLNIKWLRPLAVRK